MCKKITRLSKLKAVATPLTEIEKTALLLQVHVHKCINKLLKQNNQKQFTYFFKAATAAFNANLIDDNIYNACLNINADGNDVKHEAVMYLVMEFGSP